MRKILLIEDNETIIIGLKYTLEQENFDVDITKNIIEAKSKIKKYDYNIYLLDIALPDGEGYEICKYVKEKGNYPVIFLTAKDEEKDVVQGLDIGADDYIIKPFRTRELVSRINSVLRRYENTNIEEHKIQCKNIVIDSNTAKVYKDGKELVLTSLEYRILLMLFNNKGILIKREQLLEKIWDIAGSFVNDNTLTVYIKRIREKLDDKNGEIIQTVRGIGYMVVEK